ncbi:hypothetical protein N8I74_16765 [Chitiniphilus purpureus]|uniref:Uncharacterized protein n=1 Tax=Chitiniphilus purpureus TaxID=2981137 RepID=A0ABY6DN76_9NEIS|nr:hypothetical protein [Chitiniphilus sp. CD1]UXY14951.1 hypothetical protein N8I74_16765 [Chitiniphilus sp. CD1]
MHRALHGITAGEGIRFARGIGRHRSTTVHHAAGSRAVPWGIGNGDFMALLGNDMHVFKISPGALGRMAWQYHVHAHHPVQRAAQARAQR